MQHVKGHTGESSVGQTRGMLKPMERGQDQMFPIVWISG